MSDSGATGSEPPAGAKNATRLQRVEYATDQPAAAARFLGAYFDPHVPTVSGSQDDFRFRVTSATVDGVDIQSLDHSMTVSTTVAVPASISVVHLLKGALDVDQRGTTLRAKLGESLLCQTHEPIEVCWSDVRLGLVRFDLAELEELALELCGVDPAGLRFPGSRPLNPDAERFWQATVRYVNREILPNAWATASPIVHVTVGRMLGVALLRTFPTTAMPETLLRAPAGDDTVPTAALRRAADFIRAHAAEPVTMADIAAAARVTPRSLQHGFRRTWDTTPTAYLRRVRLENAHRDLQLADPSRGDTVAAIAARWGFGNVGRFAARYRERYGRSPNVVLRT